MHPRESRIDGIDHSFDGNATATCDGRYLNNSQRIVQSTYARCMYSDLKRGGRAASECNGVQYGGVYCGPSWSLLAAPLQAPGKQSRRTASDVIETRQNICCTIQPFSFV